MTRKQLTLEIAEMFYELHPEFKNANIGIGYNVKEYAKRLLNGVGAAKAMKKAELEELDARYAADLAAK